MKKIIKSLWIVLILLSVVGCLQVNTVIKLKPDGSDTIEETMLMSKVFFKQMKAMMEAMTGQMGQATGETEQKDGQAAQKPAKKMLDIFDEDKLADKASKMGEGVTYVSGKRLTTDKHEGCHVI